MPHLSTTLARVSPGREHLGYFVIRGEAPHHRAVRRRGDQDIQVADGLAHAPEAAGHDHLPHAGYGLQKCAQRLGILRRGGELEAPALAGMRLHRLEDVLLGLCAEAGQRADASVLRSPVQLFDGLDIQVVVQRLDPLRPQPGDLQQLGDRGRQLAAQALQQAAMAGGGRSR